MSNLKKRILLVEDEALIAIGEVANLERYGYEVWHVLHGEKAVEAVNSGRDAFDLVLMDIDLGQGIDGPEAARRILREHDLPIIFLSSHIAPEVVEKTELISSYGYVVKSSSITVLNASIKMAFRLYDSKLRIQRDTIEIASQAQALATSEKRYRRLFESAKDGIIILNATSGLIDDVNPYLKEMLGYSREDLIQKHIWEIHAFRDKEYARTLFRELQTNDYIRYEDIPLEASDGRQINVQFVSNVYLVDGQRVIQCNIRNIAVERRRQEKALESSFELGAALLVQKQVYAQRLFGIVLNLIELRLAASEDRQTRTELNAIAVRVKTVSDLYAMSGQKTSEPEIVLKTYCEKEIQHLPGIHESIQMQYDTDETLVTPYNASLVAGVVAELVAHAGRNAFAGKEKGVNIIHLTQIVSRIIITGTFDGTAAADSLEQICQGHIGFHFMTLLVSLMDGTVDISHDDQTTIRIDCNLP